MLTLTLWILAATVAAGIGLACLWLLERPFGRVVTLAAAAHGLAGAAGTALALTLILGGAHDTQGLGKVAAAMLGAALLGGAVVALSNVRRRRPAGLVVILHATLGVAGLVILLGYAATS